MSPISYQNPTDPYANLLAKLGHQLPAIQTKLQSAHWAPFKNRLDAALDLFKTAADDKGRNQAIEQIRKLTHYPQDWYLVEEIQVGVFRGTPFESGSHPVSNPAGSGADHEFQQQLAKLIAQYPDAAQTLANVITQTTNINSSGGTVITGDVAVGKDFVGGDQINVENLTIVQGESSQRNEAKSLEPVDELLEEKIRLDVAYPDKGVVAKPFKIAIGVLQPDAPKLQIGDLENIESGTGAIFRPSNQQLVKYKIKVEAPGCTVQPEEMVVPLQSGKDSPIVIFFLTAQSEGSKPITVTAYQDSELFMAQTLVHIDIVVAVGANKPVLAT